MKTLIFKSTALAVSLAMAKKNLRIDGDYLDDVVEGWIEGLTEIVEREIGQCLVRQTWRVTLDRFPAGGIASCADVCTSDIDLPHPVLAVKSVTYVDAAGETQSLPDSAYELCPTELSTKLAPTSGAGWPVTGAVRRAVKIDVECGYGDDHTNVPCLVRLYMLAKLVEQFDPTSRPDKGAPQSVFLERMLDGIRTYQ